MIMNTFRNRITQESEATIRKLKSAYINFNYDDDKKKTTPNTPNGLFMITIQPNTYVDDIVKGIKLVMNNAPEKKTGEDGLPIPPYAVYNIGNNNPENLLDFVQILSEELINAGVLPKDYDFEAHKELVPMQPGDVPITYADTSALERDFGFKPSTSLREGLRAFAKWYKKFYL